MADIRVKVFIDVQRHPVISLDIAQRGSAPRFHTFASNEEKIGEDAVVSPSVLTTLESVLTDLLNDPAVVSSLHRHKFFDDSCGGCG